jgi:hypothetical protein
MSLARVSGNNGSRPLRLRHWLSLLGKNRNSIIEVSSFALFVCNDFLHGWLGMKLPWPTVTTGGFASVSGNGTRLFSGLRPERRSENISFG